MKFSTSRKIKAEINLTALIDVTFMLLIFLLITTRFADESWLEIIIPQAVGQSGEPASSIGVLIDRHGRVYVNESDTDVGGSRDALQQALVDAADGRRDQQVHIRGDGRVNYETVVGVMDASSGLGFENIQLAVSDEVNFLSDPPVGNGEDESLDIEP